MPERPPAIKQLDAFLSSAMIAHEVIFSTRWGEQTLLDPEAAEETAGELEAELGRIDAEVKSRFDRQREIAARLREMLGP